MDDLIRQSCLVNPDTAGVTQGYIGFLLIFIYLLFSYFRLKLTIKSDDFEAPKLYSHIGSRLEFLSIFYVLLCLTGGSAAVRWHRIFECADVSSTIILFGYIALICSITIIFVLTLKLRNYFKIRREDHLKSIRLYIGGALILAFLATFVTPLMVSSSLQIIDKPALSMKKVEFEIEQ